MVPAELPTYNTILTQLHRIKEIILHSSVILSHCIKYSFIKQVSYISDDKRAKYISFRRRNCKQWNTVTRD